MNDLHGEITTTNTVTLWALIADIARVLKTRGYRQDESDQAFMIWYRVYKELEAEIDRRLLADY